MYFLLFWNVVTILTVANGNGLTNSGSPCLVTVSWCQAVALNMFFFFRVNGMPSFLDALGLGSHVPPVPSSNAQGLPAAGAPSGK